jgi:hypothetical protein
LLRKQAIGRRGTGSHGYHNSRRSTVVHKVNKLELRHNTSPQNKQCLLAGDSLRLWNRGLSDRGEASSDQIGQKFPQPLFTECRSERIEEI